MTHANKTIAFIGAGNMARAIILGLLNSGFEPDNIWASSPSILQQNAFADFAIHRTTSNTEAAKNADILVFCVKPWLLETVCAELKDVIQEKNPLLISVVTGITTQTIAKDCGKKEARIVRTMPNIAAAVGAGATGLFANAHVTHDEKLVAEELFRATGTIVWVDAEDQLDIVTVISGSGPAYLFYFLEAMQSVGELMGLTSAQVKVLVSQTAMGAAKMVMERPESFQTLRQWVTSEKGVTAAATDVFDQEKLKSTVEKAMMAALKRTKELVK